MKHAIRPETMYEGVTRSLRTESITKYTLTTVNTTWEATQRVMAAKLTRLTHKIEIQLHLVAESWIIRSSRSRRPVRKLLDTPSYPTYAFTAAFSAKQMHEPVYHHFHRSIHPNIRIQKHRVWPICYTTFTSQKVVQKNTDVAHTQGLI
jgi:hypothetical protein